MEGIFNKIIRKRGVIKPRQNSNSYSPFLSLAGHKSVPAVPLTFGLLESPSPILV